MSKNEKEIEKAREGRREEERGEREGERRKRKKRKMSGMYQLMVISMSAVTQNPIRF